MVGDEQETSQGKGPAAAASEVARAILGMSEDDALRMTRYAETRAVILRRRSPAWAADDLKQQAYALLLGGQRKWRPSDKTFVQCICEIIKSISSHERASADATVHVDRKEPHPDADALDHMQHLPQTAQVPRDPADLVSASQEAQKLLEALADDPQATQVANEIFLGLKGPDIQLKLNLSVQEYETVVLRIRRKSRKSGLIRS